MNLQLSPSPMMLLDMDITLELAGDCPAPRAWALRMALACISLAQARVVVPKLRDGYIEIGTGREQHVDPREFRSGPISILVAQHAKDAGVAQDITTEAQTGSSRAPGWEPIFVEVMGGVCE